MGCDTRLTFAAARRGTRFTRFVRAGATAVLALALTGAAQAFPTLMLTGGSPDIITSFIEVSYTGNSAGGQLIAGGTLATSGALTPPGSPAGSIINSTGTFSLVANINEAAQTANAMLTLGGEIPGLGFNSATLLTGSLVSTAADRTFGATANGPLEFLFDVTGGDAAGLFGSTAGVILSNSGYTGSFGSAFDNASLGTPFLPAGQTDTFGVTVPEPGTLLLLAAGGLLLHGRRKASNEVADERHQRK